MRTKEGHGALAPAGGLFDSCSLLENSDSISLR